MEIRKAYTIGFTKRTAEEFFSCVSEHRIGRMLDVRLRPASQLSGFAKQKDLEYFLHKLLDIKYVYAKSLAPTTTMLDSYRKKEITWHQYETEFKKLIGDRKIEEDYPLDFFDIPTVLLCSENTPDKCHRRLALEQLNISFGGALEIVHL